MVQCVYDCTIFHFHTFTKDIPYTWYRVLFSRSIISNSSATARCVSLSILVLQPSHYLYSFRLLLPKHVAELQALENDTQTVIDRLRAKYRPNV